MLDELLIVDAGVPEYRSLVADATGRAAVRVIRADDDPVAVISDALGQGPVNRLHLVGHGETGRLFLGRGALDANTLIERSAATGAWADLLAGAEILVYGCNVGQRPEGTRFLDLLAATTGARVSASSREVGHIALRESNWALDMSSHSGPQPHVLFSQALRETYAGTLNRVTFSLSQPYVTEVPAPGETGPTFDLIFELDEAPAAGTYVSVWVYASATPNAPLSQALAGGQAINELDIFKALNPAYYSGIEFPVIDQSVSAGLSNFPDQYVFEIRITEKTGVLTLVGFDDTSYYGSPTSYNPRTFYWNVIDAPNDSVSNTIVNGSQKFTEYHSIDDVPVENNAPDAVADSASTNYETAVTISVLANDSDADGDTLSLSGVTQGAHGSVAISGTRVVYTPDTGFSGNDTFSYTISDGNGGTDTATVSVTVAEKPNTAPDAVNDSANVVPGGTVTVDVLANDSDADGDALSIASVGRPSNGTASIVDGKIVYTPNAGFTGADSVTYTVSDGQGSTDTARVNFTVALPVVSISANRTVLSEDDLDTVTLTFTVQNLPAEGARVGLAAYRAGDSGQDLFQYGINEFVLQRYYDTASGTVLYPVFSGLEDATGWDSPSEGLSFTITSATATVTLPLWPDPDDLLPGDPGYFPTTTPASIH
ncbi:Ig-like domain-containing protein [Tropicimonas sp.]|uniref:Ig-like domain-containing protein n=1 Tax=Tropicimonas sp. TaxID=2067044 RepID=UPI003A84B26D